MRATGRHVKVYNVQVEEDNTYFVGGGEWGFSVWTHNVMCGEKPPKAIQGDYIEQNGISVISAEGSGQRVGNSGGRLGSPETRGQIEQLARDFEANGWEVTHGGGEFNPEQARLPEEYLPPTAGVDNGNYVDLTVTKEGEIIRINTVSTIDGVTPTADEIIAAAQIRAKLPPGEELILIPKPN